MSLSNFLNHNSNNSSETKMSTEEIEAIREACSDDSTKVIEYLEEKSLEQAKHEKFNTILNIITLIFAIISAIPTIMQIINLIFPNLSLPVVK